ncbi:MAG: hydrogenase formation protein HypD [Deltaproteobacteria bacterium]|nr:hydrogenase formation protein HypD [Deltaproteobacteria bacterium]
MKYADEYRDGTLAAGLVSRIKNRSTKKIRLMEICGTHTMAIFRHGIRTLLPPTIELISGPGCPVCVTATGDIDKAIKLAGEDGVILATFGDLIRVPGSRSSLKEERSRGADVRVGYSAMDALDLAVKNPAREVVFIGIGFETTAPTIAAGIIQAATLGVKNFSVLAAHKLPPPKRNWDKRNPNSKTPS